MRRMLAMALFLVSVAREGCLLLSAGAAGAGQATRCWTHLMRRRSLKLRQRRRRAVPVQPPGLCMCDVCGPLRRSTRTTDGICKQ